MPEYTFDLKLFTTINIEAETEEEARNLVRNHVDGGFTNFGAWPNGDPILSEVYVDDDELPVTMINGEYV